MKIRVLMESSNIGNKLSLKVIDGAKYTGWSVSDTLNGNSLVSEIDSPIYGFYKANDLITVHLHTNKNIIDIHNIEIENSEVMNNNV